MTRSGDSDKSGLSPLARPRIPPAVRLAVSVGLLLILLSALGVRELAARLAALHPGWVSAALVLSFGQVLLLGWRWQVTARALGVSLRFRTAVVEYYLGIFLNQVLPGGILGDLARAWRQSRSDPDPPDRGAALRAVVLERASAQGIMTGAALGCTVYLLARSGVLFGGRGALLSLSIGLLVLGAGAVLGRGALRRGGAVPARGSLAGRTWEELRRDARRALLSSKYLGFHLLTGSLVVASYVSVFLAAARAVGVETDFLQLAPLVPPVLMTMLLPVTIAGWGLREGAAGALWEGVGLSPADGILISMVYGLLVLMSSLPGGWVLLGSPRLKERRDQTEGRPRAEMSDSGDGLPPQGSESAPG